jgi:4-alpha-glucanotransferase
MRRNLVEFLRDRGFLKKRNPKPREVLAAVLEFLAASPAETVLATLEDLWCEERPQNVPGTSTERPNWRRKTTLSLEEIKLDPEIREMLRLVSAQRN